MNQSNELISVWPLDFWLPFPNHNIHRLVITLLTGKKKKKKQIVLTHIGVRSCSENTYLRPSRGYRNGLEFDCGGGGGGSVL